jgi:hypothetical protein
MPESNAEETVRSPSKKSKRYEEADAVLAKTIADFPTRNQQARANRENDVLAKMIATVSPLPYETAYYALVVGGKPRELAFNILEAEIRYAAGNKEMDEAMRKLRELIPARAW